MDNNFMENEIYDYYTHTGENDRLYATDVPLGGRIASAILCFAILLLMPFFVIVTFIYFSIICLQLTKKERKQVGSFILFELISDFSIMIFWYLLDHITLSKSEAIAKKAKEASYRYIEDERYLIYFED